MITFESLGLSPEIVKAVTEMGFEQPMPVQEKVIPLLLQKETDIVALAQTGTGKTAAFGIPIIQQINTQSKNTQALVLAPTRELCLQIADDLNEFAKYVNDIHIIPVYGGASIDTQIRALKNGAQVIVATPGRLIDLMNRKAARLNNVTKVVLDEADEMLNMGFTEDLNTILAGVPESRNTLLFSATMPQEIAAIAKNYMRNPIEVTIGRKNTGAENIKHICYTVHAKDKYLALKRIADYNPYIFGIVFCRTRKETQEVADKLMHDGYNADALHGDLSQSQRDFVMHRFRLHQLNLLVATDVAARGIDVDDLTHVINYNLPDDIEIYTHRSGRTGRAGKTGVSVAIINIREKHSIKQIERLINKQFVFANVPTGKEICEKQLFSLIDKMERVEIDHTEIEPYLPIISRKLEWIDKDELVKRFVSLEFNRFLDYYKNSKDIDVPTESNRREFSNDYSRNERPGRRDGARDGARDSFRDRDRDRDRGKDRDRKSNRDHKSEEGFKRLFINLGKADGMFPNNLIELINHYNKGKRIQIGRIELMKSFSFFEVPDREAPFILESMKKATFDGRRVAVDLASSPEEGRPKKRR
jgi:ATP-dependent RNA helicase DeaD